ncbi:hypothetical protein [Peribacillus deserti]|uniref:Uncharacterized protein n=1 Tax=Peribacillus deserti TaxID=673318 RepID=A0A2N5M5Z4_9BACI|nr:hypothetical protein [Peribacillus deserti]PLT29765.1 hypothetical protein CUU66_11295 [Peribacillus deserti]
MERVAAYFRNENDAEDVRVKLQALTVSDVMVDKVPEDNNRILDIIRDVFRDEDHSGQHRPYIVEFLVSEADFEQAKAIVNNNNGHFQ